MDGSETHLDVDSKEKSKHLRWYFAMDNVLINILVEEARQGRKTGKHWKDSVWKVEQEKFRGLRGRSPKWDFQKLSIIMNKSNATEHSVSGTFVCTDVIKMDRECIDDFYLLEKDPNIGDIEEGVSVLNDNVGRRPVSPSTQKCHRKKPRAMTIEAVKEIVEGINAKIQQLDKSLDPLAFAGMLYAELMKTEGFSSKYLDSAFGILRRDSLEAENFLVRSVEFRKEMLERLREKIGDV
ncbi:hypothetical protein GIB67_026588 [Kingdonia uniflora]|uniref:Myb/SANT-like domain-containing protein n=1 Tax=Kingdonia uniflora TaxID=39325 RepID=A0A7J7NP21_9MAGN|nr:hypothetical protein GIB67_026588 [Kingdonia uniflora]